MQKKYKPIEKLDEYFSKVEKDNENSVTYFLVMYDLMMVLEAETCSDILCTFIVTSIVI
jgi:hypothetical protein